MLMDMLGIVIGFVTVISLLSLLVTAIVQMLQSIFRLRGRSLRAAIEGLFHSLDEDIEINPKFHVGELLRRIALDRPKANKSPLRGILGPGSFSNCTVDDLLQLVPPEQRTSYLRDRLKSLFPKMEARAFGLFTFRMRYLSIIVSLIVACYMQINSLDLLKRLSSDAQLRANLNAEADRIVAELNAEDEAEEAKQGGDNLMSKIAPPDMPLIGETALSKLPDKIKIDGNPLDDKQKEEVIKRIEPVAARALEKDLLVEEMRLVLLESDGDVSRQKIIETYEATIRELLEDHDKKVAENTQEHIDRIKNTTRKLSALGFTPWKDGWAFFKDGGNIFGVVLTAGLLSFGAPFWFERLRDLIHLRNALHSPATNDPNRTADDQTGKDKREGSSKSSNKVAVPVVKSDQVDEDVAAIQPMTSTEVLKQVPGIVDEEIAEFKAADAKLSELKTEVQVIGSGEINIYTGQLKLNDSQKNKLRGEINNRIAHLARISEENYSPTIKIEPGPAPAKAADSQPETADDKGTAQ